MKTAVVTGSTSGIGLSIALNLTRKGYRVICVGHSEMNCKKANEYLMSENPEADIIWFRAELMQQREVNRVAEEISRCVEEECGGKLHALINNAGGVRSWYTTTDEGYEQQFALNHLAQFMLTYRLMPYIQNARGKVLMTCSGSHKGIKMRWDDVMLSKRYNPLTAYKQSKLAGILFAKGLRDRGIRAYAIDPGLVKTQIGNKGTGGLVNAVWNFRKRQGVNPDVSAQTYVYICENDEADGLYYKLCKERKYSPQVTRENADRLFALSERLCAVSYDKGERGIV